MNEGALGEGRRLYQVMIYLWRTFKRRVDQSGSPYYHIAVKLEQKDKNNSNNEWDKTNNKKKNPKQN